MKLHRFCAKCGRPLSGEEYYGKFLCRDCYGAEKPVEDLTLNLTLRRCVFCGAISLKNGDQEYNWEYPPEDMHPVDYLTNLLFVKILDKKEKKEQITYNIFFDQDVSLYQEKDIVFLIQSISQDGLQKTEKKYSMRLRDISCPYCARKRGGRFDAILQLRYFHSIDADRLALILNYCKIIEEEERQINPENFITKVEPTKNGYDLKLSTNVMLRRMVSRLRSRYFFMAKYSKKLMGINHEDGSEKYRQHVLLKLIPVRENDRIIINNEEFIIKKIFKNKIKARSLSSGKIQQLKFDVFEKKKWQLK